MGLDPGAILWVMYYTLHLKDKGKNLYCPQHKPVKVRELIEFPILETGYYECAHFFFYIVQSYREMSENNVYFFKLNDKTEEDCCNGIIIHRMPKKFTSSINDRKEE
jgi:hypothetical protein